MNDPLTPVYPYFINGYHWRKIAHLIPFPWRVLVAPRCIPSSASSLGSPEVQGLSGNPSQSYHVYLQSLHDIGREALVDICNAGICSCNKAYTVSEACS